MPLHLGAVATFQAAALLNRSGDLRLDDIGARLASRLEELPALRRRLALAPLGLDSPRWVDDPDFDVARHVGELHLPAGADESTLRRVAGDLVGPVLPRDRPLWDLRFLTGLDGGRVALVERVHHALVDGVSGVDVASILLDLAPDAPAGPAATWRPAPVPSRLDLVADAARWGLAAP